jgi:hypothetical protein
MKTIDNTDLKYLRCFPNLIHYDYKDDINPKSVPLTKSILKNKISPKNQKNKSVNIKDSPKSSLVVTNSNKNIFNLKHSYLKTFYNNNYSQSPEDHLPIKSVKYYRNKNIYQDDEINNIINSISSRTKH